MAVEKIRVGCCGFAGSRKRYFQAFRVVEIQETFYEPPKVATARKWRAEAPEGFEFTMKAWQLITHTSSSPTYRRLRTKLSDSEKKQAGNFRPTRIVLEAWERTAETARALEADKILFQCPASFKPTEENKKNLISFFEHIDREGFTLLWEPRGVWQPEEIRELCRRLNLIHCVDPFSARPVTRGLRYFRLHGKGGYRYKYSDPELRELLEMAQGRFQVYVLFNNVSMFEDAQRFQRLIG